MNTNLGRGNFNRKERRDPKDQRDAMTLINAQVAGQWRTAFSYDGLNRRRIMKNYSWSGSGWVQTNEMRLIYDGLKIIQERDTNNAVLVTYTRGNDMSGTLQGAGGIGGLLARTDTSGTDYYHADGSGNVTVLMNASQHIVGRYLYGPLGRLLGQWGAKSGANVMRFSSKPYLALTDDYDFGFRRYRPDLQRWLNQDPIGEQGGMNLYAFAGNDLINAIDTDGLKILIIGHIAAKPLGRLTNPNSYHLAIYIDPDDKAAMRGSWPITLGGQKGSNSKLINAPNYPGDALEDATFKQELKPPPCQTEAEFIRNLMNAVHHYQNNLDYSLPNIGWIPGIKDGAMPPGKYNSNSYVSGLINAAGGTPPNINTGGNFQVPGYANPIPIPDE